MHIIESSRAECEHKAAETIAMKLNEIVSKKGRAVFGICGGTSVENIFRLLLTMEINWNQVHIFLVDERCVSLHSTDSNYRLAYNAFIKTLEEQHKLSQENVHPFIYEEGQTVGSLRKYTTKLAHFGGTFDLILLSSGEDGHVAALYPKHRSITNETKDFFIMKDSPKPPKERMTASRKLLQTASVALLLFFGKEKQKAFEKFNTPIKIEECPVKLVQVIPDVHIFRSLD